MCISVDGYVTTPDGRPVQLADPNWSPQAYGFVEFQAACDAVLMGRTTFEPALGAEQWPWGELGVYVLASHRPTGTPEHVVVESDPAHLLAAMRDEIAGDVHLVGGPTTIETFRRLDALGLLGLVVVPVFVGGGLRLTPAIDTDTRLALESEHALENGAVELVYAVV
jgi:dihydrofolate reductase